ncbi:DUF924 family protein [Psychrobacter sp. 72-O-c]|uniref:DUF924 family protein n=1 Tax=Psychrobacter sp. 72-O-c TaxID=2774125 RepID=UPI001919DBD3|nr:DUF924 family protein [Psychrobacter sp. 72-O-c]
MSLSTDYSTSIKQPDSTQLDSTDLNLDYLHSDARAVLDFWFDKDNEPYWFLKDDKFDQKIADKFGEIWQAASQGECVHWRRTEGQLEIEAYTNTDDLTTDLAGRLAEIIVLDQFSRNLCRGQASAFGQDKMALVLAQEAIHQTAFNDLPWKWRQFMIMPFMHSESAAIQERYLSLFEQLDDTVSMDFAHAHQAIIEQFGRYPHRNAALNRTSTAAEKEFLEQPDSSF